MYIYGVKIQPQGLVITTSLRL